MLDPLSPADCTFFLPSFLADDVTSASIPLTKEGLMSARDHITGVP